MNAMLIHVAIFLVGLLALAGFACYICRGRPATSRFSRQRARERRTLQAIEWHLLAGPRPPRAITRARSKAFSAIAQCG